MDWVDWARGVFALVATLALIVGFAVVARRFGMIAPGAGAGPRRLNVVESLMLDPRRRLVLVRLDGNDHLLLLSAAGDQAVATVPAPAPVPASAPAPAPDPVEGETPVEAAP